MEVKECTKARDFKNKPGNYPVPSIELEKFLP